MKDDLLPLESNVLGPLDESSEVGVGGEVSSDSERSSLLLEEGVLGLLLASLGV